MSVGGYRLLRYWSLNLWLARRSGWSFPGFSYTDAEAERLKALSDAIGGTAGLVWLAATVAICLALAAMLITGLFSLLSAMFPNPADLPAAGFFGALVLAAVGMVALGLPLSIALGGWIADLVAGPPPPPGPGDAALAAKVGGQFVRMGLVVAVLMVAMAVGWSFLLRRH